MTVERLEELEERVIRIPGHLVRLYAEKLVGKNDYRLYLKVYQVRTTGDIEHYDPIQSHTIVLKENL